MTQYFAEYYSIASHGKENVSRKGCGTGLPSVGETKQSRLELSSLWNKELVDWRYWNLFGLIAY